MASSSSAASVLGKKRSRKQQVEEEDQEDELSGVVGSGKPNANEAEEEEEDEEDDEFEIDTGSSNGDLDDFVVASDNEDDQVEANPTVRSVSRSNTKNGRSRSVAEQEDEGGLADSESEEDSQAGLDLDDEEGYNSSDIDALDSDDEAVVTPATSVSSSKSLDALIKRHTSKPTETEYQGHRSVITGGRALTGDGRWGTDKYSSAKEGSGRLRESKFVEGSFVREYDEFEAGYGSESSTEEVGLPIGSCLFSPLFAILT